ncbi:MAG: hypothetical protein ACJ73W_11460 [Rubrobacteraceae bacterium]
MTEALLLIVVGSLVPISVATLIFALLTLRKAHLYVILAEQRFEHLREGQVLLLALLREQSRSSETTAQEHRAQEPVLREREPLTSTVRTRGIDKLGLHGPLWNAGRGAVDELGVGSSLPDWPPEDTPGTHADKVEESPKERGSESRPRAANFPDTTSSSRPAKAVPEAGVSRRAVWHPHPDDDVSPAQVGGPSGVTVKMFRMHYDKYLDNYEGYVKLAARLFRMRDDAEIEAGSAAEGDWDERLRRVTDGIQRTTARLDILEEYNPELATDDRISRRAAIARDQRELELQRR